MPTYPRPVPRPTRRQRIRPLLVLCALGACVALAACGSSGGGATSAKRSSTSASNAGAPGGGPGGFQLPKGVTRAQLQAALKKCGADRFLRRRPGTLNSASSRAGLVKYAACLRQNGVNVPAPNTCLLYTSPSPRDGLLSRM